MAVLQETAKIGNAVGATPCGCPSWRGEDSKPVAPNACPARGFRLPRAESRGIRRNLSTSRWAADFLFTGTSALLLLIASFFPNYWYLSFFALTPFLWRIVRADSKTSFFLGLLFGLTFFSIYFSNDFQISFFPTIFKILSGTALFASFAWTVSKAKEKLGFNPLVVALLWVVFELALINVIHYVGATGGRPLILAGDPPLIETTPFFHGLALLFGFLSVSFVIVLVNSVLIFAVEKTVHLAKAQGQETRENERQWDLFPIPGLFAQKVYLIPQFRAPPLSYL